MLPELEILRPDYRPAYRAQTGDWLAGWQPHIPTVEFTADTFGFYTSVSAVFSWKIEGENIDLDSYLKHRFKKAQYTQDYTQKIDDLFAAYEFARRQPLPLANVLKAHAKLTKHILASGNRGRIRTHPELILDKDGRIEYVAVGPDIVRPETEKLFRDVARLLVYPLDQVDVFYFSACIHLVFLKIQPLADGNGRTARLLEKWFLAGKLGDNAWYIPSERYYHEHLIDWCRSVHIGFDYDSLKYDRCLPMLMMLPQSLVSLEH